MRQFLGGTNMDNGVEELEVIAEKRKSIENINSQLNHRRVSALDEAVRNAELFGGFTGGGYFVLTTRGGTPLYVDFRGKAQKASIANCLFVEAIGKVNLGIKAQTKEDIIIQTPLYSIVFYSGNTNIDIAIALLWAVDMGEMTRGEARVFAAKIDNSTYKEIASQIDEDDEY